MVGQNVMPQNLSHTRALLRSAPATPTPCDYETNLPTVVSARSSAIKSHGRARRLAANARLAELFGVRLPTVAKITPRELLITAPSPSRSNAAVQSFRRAPLAAVAGD